MYPYDLVFRCTTVALRLSHSCTIAPLAVVARKEVKRIALVLHAANPLAKLFRTATAISALSKFWKFWG